MLIALSSQQDVLGTSKYYQQAIESFGHKAVELPAVIDENNIDEIINTYDGFVLTGGVDVNPAYYSEDNCYCNDICDTRDKSDYFLIERLLLTDKPILAICRGMQFLNVALGGTLYQDIIQQGKTTHNHSCVAQAYDLVHQVDILPNKLSLCGQIGVNSLHHQAVKTLGKGLRAIAVSIDGIIEAYEHEDKPFVIGIQWHPEKLYTQGLHKELFVKFLEAIKGR